MAQPELRERDKVKPCPFCGEAEGLEYALSDDNRQVHVWCGKCGAEGPLGDCMEGAAAAWNHREA